MSSPTDPAPLTRRLSAELRPHPSAELVPVMQPDEYAAFLADIAERDILVPLEINQDGSVLDGRHRLRAATELGIDTVPVRIVSPTDEHMYVLLAAVQRRHLSASQ